MTATRTKRTKIHSDSFNSDENVLSTYLKEINRIPLLTREEENTAARGAAQGKKQARDRLINANLRFVVNVAKKYQGQGIPLADLISEGNIGLISAVERYDVNKGYHFISYAVWWIRQSILKAICEKSRMIRLPQNRANELIQIGRARKLVQENQSPGGEIREIAELLNVDQDYVAELVNISRDLVSLENAACLTDRKSNSMEDFIEDENYKAPEDYAVDQAMHRDIEAVLNTLDRKEAEIIRFRYGLGNTTPMSLQEIGEKFNLTKERIRQIEKKAHTRLQHPTRQRLLAAYVA
jgi:RNA polymerase primary sigma factor